MKWPWRRSTISRDEHDRRVTELLAANTHEVERRRSVEKVIEEVARVLHEIADCKDQRHPLPSTDWIYHRLSLALDQAEVTGALENGRLWEITRGSHRFAHREREREAGGAQPS